ncbi:class I SAM-dependent methyltransferase [Nocardioides guangzhouensis]|uniref:Class I SAM-dependent methyltransferase n=1 Tax=Nocardioides guangzhouensis TaxID=2497878 RepID=A0A4Q4ZCC6_9ACTN|nr:methyltransferase domain-containing protein [Nocardioides guangzhouensis]RYP85338.1 class I SAM-dependent methyltransferase [Nocardioides guangzhouensis]
MTTQHETGLDLSRLEEFAGKVAGDQAAAYNAILVYLGDRLGLWSALAALGTASVDELANRSGVTPRYLQEWLSAQAANGYVTYDAATDTFTLPAEHASVVADEASPASLVPGFELIAAVWAAVDKLAHSYTTGQGLPWHEHDPRLFSAVSRFYAIAYRTSLLTEWLPAVDGLVERLESGIRVLDVGCGLGVPTILLAEAFPNSTFVGVDYHHESVRQATAAAVEAGVSGRVRFAAADATSYAGEFDLVLFFDAVHDFGDPVGALAHARRALAPGGQVVAIEPYAEDTLAANLSNPIAAVFYVGSSCLCVPHSISQGGAALGAQAGPEKLTAAFRDAGFADARVATATAYNLVLQAAA